MSYTCPRDSPLSKAGMRETCLTRVEYVATDAHEIRSLALSLCMTYYISRKRGQAKKVPLIKISSTAVYGWKNIRKNIFQDNLTLAVRARTPQRIYI